MTPTELISTGGRTSSARDFDILTRDGSKPRNNSGTDSFESELRRAEPQESRHTRSEPPSADTRSADAELTKSSEAGAMPEPNKAGAEFKTSEMSGTGTSEELQAPSPAVKSPDGEQAQISAETLEANAITPEIQIDGEAVAETTEVKGNTDEKTGNAQIVDTSIKVTPGIPDTSSAAQPVADSAAAVLPQQGNAGSEQGISQTDTGGLPASQAETNARMLPESGVPPVRTQDSEGPDALRSGNESARNAQTTETVLKAAAATIPPVTTPAEQQAATGASAPASPETPNPGREAATTVAVSPTATDRTLAGPAPLAHTPQGEARMAAPVMEQNATPAQQMTVEAGDMAELPNDPLPDDVATLPKPATPQASTFPSGMTVAPDMQDDGAVIARQATQSVQADAPVIIPRAEPQPGQVLRPVPVPEQISVAVGHAKEHGRIELRLDPPDLGRVQIQLNTSEEGVRAVIMAEKAETQDLLRRHAELLARELRDSGFEGVALEFADSSQMTEGGADEEILTLDDTLSPEPDGTDTSAPVKLRTALQAGLDIRL